MMLEEAGYNPFMEGDADSQQPRPLEGGHGFLETDSPYNYGNKRLSFLENTSSKPPGSPIASPSPNHSPYSSLRVMPPPEEKRDALENPFFNDPPAISVSHSEGSSPIPALPPSSPLSKSSSMTSPLLRTSMSNSQLAVSSPSPQPSAPASPALTSPRSDPAPAPLFTYHSLAASSAYVVTVDKVDWVPDAYSITCEHCAHLFTFIRRRHHCRVCGHLFCGECIVKATLPPALGFLCSQKTCVRCAYKVVRTRGNFTATLKSRDGVSIGQMLSGKMHKFMYRMAGMYEGGKFDRFAGGLTSPLQFSSFPIAEVIPLKIPSHDSYLIPAMAYIPKGDGPFPVLVYIPGGAFVLGEVDNSVIVAFCKELCSKVGCIVISVGYRLAPEHHHPLAWEDCYSAVKWVYESSALDLSKLEKDPQVVVCGEGSGGLLAAAVCQMARDRGSPPLRYQLLITPWLNLTTINLDKFENSYVLTKDLMKWVLQQVFQDPSDKDKPYVSPFLTSSVANLPPTKIISAGYDPMHYEAEEYANRLRNEGVSASVTRYENSLHGFVGNYVDSYSESEEAMFECVVCLREVYGLGEFLATKPKHRDSTDRMLNL